MNKFISLFISAVLLLASFAVSAGAVGLDAGTQALNAEFSDGECPDGFDYVAFSPVSAADDSVKYPLFIWLHGMRSGEQPRAQLNNYEFSNWASDEYQARFVNAGGCFLIAPRVSNDYTNSWEPEMCAELMRTIEYYISQNADNIDRNRIYIAGYSTGGSMVWDMLAQYPNYFAAAVPAAAIYPPTNSSLNKMGKTAVWALCCDKDPYPLAETADVKPCFEYLAKLSSKHANLRLTTFSEAVFADGRKLTETVNGVAVTAQYAEHYIWEAVTYDMFMSDRRTPYLFASTIDGEGGAVELNEYGNGIISWLSAQTLEDAGDDKEISFLERIMMIINRIIEFFKSLFA